MRIVVQEPTQSDVEGTIVRVSHSLPEDGEVATMFRTHHVQFIQIQGHGTIEIDLSRENLDDQVKVYDHDGHRLGFVLGRGEYRSEMELPETLRRP